MFHEIAIASAAAMIALSSAATAAEMKVTGTMQASETQQQVLPSGGPDHIIVTMLDKGTTKSAGSPLDGATIVLSETAILDKGNGPQAGIISLANDKGSITDEIRGTVKTVMVDGKPHMTTSGTYKMIVGTGMFAGASGHGTYSVSFTSEKDWVGEYNGVLSMPKMEASR